MRLSLAGVLVAGLLVTACSGGTALPDSTQDQTGSRPLGTFTVKEAVKALPVILAAGDATREQVKLPKNRATEMSTRAACLAMVAEGERESQALKEAPWPHQVRPEVARLATSVDADVALYRRCAQAPKRAQMIEAVRELKNSQTSQRLIEARDAVRKLSKGH